MAHRGFAINTIAFKSSAKNRKQRVLFSLIKSKEQSLASRIIRMMKTL